ncbi:hypothetical protein BH09BAC2_BH09BAC2_10550 [soil metagenome]
MNQVFKFSNQLTMLTTLALLAISTQSCNEKPKEKEATINEFSLTTAKAEIEEADRNFMELFAKRDSVGLANAYTVDAKLMKAGAPSVVGRTNIQKAWNDMLNSGLTRVDLKLENIFGTEALIAEEGIVTLFVKNDTVGVEKYIVLWKKEDGKWKLFRDIFNSNLPAK